MAEPGQELGAGRLLWTRRTSLTVRILAVNIIALGLLAGSLFYLDNYRRDLLAERFVRARAEAEITANALSIASRSERRKLIGQIGLQQGMQLRLYDRRNRLVADSFELAEPSFTFTNPADTPWYEHAGRALDRGMDFILGAPPIPEHVEPEDESGKLWPEVAEARRTRITAIRHRTAPDGTPVISAAIAFGQRGEVLLTTRNPTDITQNVRDARQTLAIVVGAALLVSIQLSLFLARTIVQPLRELGRAAVRVRLGRDREVVVPRLPERRDEIGLLARAVSDMTTALRQRIDAVESFAADVAHEIKNPLASLQSALESLDKVEDPALRRQLMGIAAHDVKRIDRLVTEISDASRIDAELSRTEFEPVDMVRLVTALVAARDERMVNAGCTLSIARDAGAYVVPGDAARLERVLENLFDNAVSFSPPGGHITITLSREPGRIVTSVSDEGPGIPPEQRERVFDRFNSLRPIGEAFGNHSGLGLAIARTIVEAHGGTLTASDRPDGKPGACLIIDLPDWEGH
jgi:two-component system, OmpR family, sensor histidine kinase ChvG